MDEAGTYGVECSRKVVSGRGVAGAIRPIVNAKDLQLGSARLLHETKLAPVLTYGSDTMLWRERERSRMDNLRGLPGIRGMDGALNPRIE